MKEYLTNKKRLRKLFCSAKNKDVIISDKGTRYSYKIKIKAFKIVVLRSETDFKKDKNFMRHLFLEERSYEKEYDNLAYSVINKDVFFPCFRIVLITDDNRKISLPAIPFDGGMLRVSEDGKHFRGEYSVVPAYRNCYIINPKTCFSVHVN